MKKTIKLSNILKILVMLILTVSVLAVSALADEIAPAEPTENEPTLENVFTEEETTTLVERFKEYVMSGSFTEALSLTVSLALIVIIYYLKKKFGEIGVKILTSNKGVNDKLIESDSTRVLADNIVTERLEEMKARLDNTVSVADIKRLEQMVYNIAETLHMVYQGSATVPAVVKERVLETFNRTEKLVTPDTDIIAEETNENG